MIEHLLEETLAMHCMRVLLFGSKASTLLASALLVVSPLFQVIVEKTTAPQPDSVISKRLNARLYHRFSLPV